MPTDEAKEIVDTVRSLHAAGKCGIPVGRGSQSGRGAPPGEGTKISTAALDRITRFDPDDLTCGVEPGVRLGTLQEQLAGAGLTLEAGPHDPARTLGGLIAEAPPSSRGFDRGALRSQLIGIHAVDGRGRVFHAGGKVVKNVAGYDLCKLFCGSGGAFFIALELQLRLTRMPERATWLSSQPMARSEAASLWQHTRKRAADARAIDWVAEPGGAARVEVLLAGPSAVVEALAEQLELSPSDARSDAWNGAPATQAVDGCSVRGRILPTAIDELAPSLPAEASGRVHAQGAFAIEVGDLSAARFGPEAIVRPIAGAPPATAHTSVTLRLKQEFGGNLCPQRLSFDTAISA